MPLSYLKQTGFTIPSGYAIARGAMTADSRRVYFAAAHDSYPMMLIYDMDGGRQEAAEFSIHVLGAGRSFDAIAHDAEKPLPGVEQSGAGEHRRCVSVLETGDGGQTFCARRDSRQSQQHI